MIFLLIFSLAFCQEPCGTFEKDDPIEFQDCLKCLKSVDFDSDIRDESIAYVKNLLDLYVYRDIVTDSGEPWHQTIDLLKDIDELSQKDLYNSDFEFHSELRDIMTKLKDAHTAYIPPMCYGFKFYQPFPIRQLEDGSFEISDFWSQSDIDLQIPEKFEKIYPSRTDLYTNPYKGSKILFIDGLDPQDVIKDYTENECSYSRDPMICYNHVLRSEWHKRSTFRNKLPEPGSIKYTIAYNNTNYDLISPWIAVSTMSYRFESMKMLCGYEKPPAEERRSSAYENMKNFLQSSTASYLPTASTIVQKIVREQLNVYQINEMHEQHMITENRRRQVGGEGQEQTLTPSGYEHVSLNRDRKHSYYRLYYNNVTMTALLKVLTFMPDFDILGPQNEETILAALESFTAYFEQVHSAFYHINDLGAKKLILDVRGNVGGVGCLAFVLLRYVSPYSPLDPSPNSDLVYTKLGDALHCKFNIVDRLSFFGQDRKPVTSDWYSTGPNRKRGKKTSQYSSMIHFGCSMQMLILGAEKRWEASPKMFEPEDVLVFTDGTCGSTCGIFVKLIQYLGLGRVVTHGGTFGPALKAKRAGMNAASFPGGAVTTGSQLISEINLYASVCPVEEFKFEKPQSNALMTFAWMEIYAWEPKIAAFELDKVDDTKPMGHKVKPGDFHLDTWDFGNDIFARKELLQYFDICASWEIRRNDACEPEDPFPHSIYGNPCSEGNFTTSCVLKGCEGGWYLAESGKQCLPMPEEYDLIGMAVKVLLAGFFVAATIICFYLCYFCCICMVIMMVCIACVLAIFRLGRRKGRATNRGGLNEGGRMGEDQEEELGEYSRLRTEEDTMDDENDEVEMGIEESSSLGNSTRITLMGDQDEGIIN